MDDPLRPKTVPLAAETILWFEFLLDPSLLTAHLNKSNPDPSPLDLISQFLTMSPDNQIIQADLATPEIEPNVVIPIVENMKLVRKQLAIKILTLKLCTHLNWNLDKIERGLPLQKQIFLFRDLCTFACGKPISVPIQADTNLQISSEGSEKAARFAFSLYYRWVLRMQILKDIAMKATKPIIHVIGAPEPVNPFAIDLPTQGSVEYLTKCVDSEEEFFIFSYETFVALHHNSTPANQNFDKMTPISKAELRAQVLFDLCGFYLYSKQYYLAKAAVKECRENYLEMKNEYEQKGLKKFFYCHLDEEELEGYLLACGFSLSPISLLEQLHTSTLNKYEGILEILKLDNKSRKIPMVNRRILELDIEGVISQNIVALPKDLNMQVGALNVIRAIFEEGNIFANVSFFEKYKIPEAFNAVAKGLIDVLSDCSPTDRNRIKEFLIDYVMKNGDSKTFKTIEEIKLFAAAELDDLKRQVVEEEIIVPPMASQLDWKWSSKISRIEIGSLERQLIACNNAKIVRKLLVKLAATNPSKPLYTINPSWQIPGILEKNLMSLQRGFLQDFSFVVLGKASEMASKKDFAGAVSMLTVLKSDMQRTEFANNIAMSNISKMVGLEILYTQVCQALEEWSKPSLDLQSLANRCKQCLSQAQGNDVPRIEIIEHCAIMLLNLKNWIPVMVVDKRYSSLDVVVSFAAAFIEIGKQKCGKKICRDPWEVVLGMFLIPGSNNSNKRGNNSRDSPCLVPSNLYGFLNKIRDISVFSLAISLLAKIHNILKDDSTFDLETEYISLWPTTISNPINGYNIRAVSDTLNWLLKRALKYYPDNVNWLKLKGDLELAIGNNEAAIRCYLNAIITGTEYFALPLQRPIIDDYIIKKMIKCCSNLGCHMQAAVLCQFLDDIDYGLAFKNISEKSSNFVDAMDAHYNCIFDATLLEFIVNMHSKKAEHNRKLETIAVMSNLELNANNSEEVKREAATIRKIRFLRALAKQYLL